MVAESAIPLNGGVAARFVIFRAPNLHVAGSILSSMAGFGGLEPLGHLDALLSTRFLVTLVLLLAFVQFAPNTWEVRAPPRIAYGLVTGFAAALAIMTIASPHPFIYFQF